jgi:Flp pilus assembly protein TadB
MENRKQGVMDFKGFVIAALLVSLFIYAAISLSTTLSSNQNKNFTLLENEAINRSFTNIQTELEDSEATTSAQREAFEEDTAEEDIFVLNLKSIISVGRKFTQLVVNLYSLTFGMIAEVLGISVLVLTIITSIIIITLILLAWSVFRIGK